MGFRTINGRAYSENGWRFCDANECDTGVVPGTTLRLPIRRGIANIILKGWCAYFHRHIESLNNHRGFTDEGAWTATNSVSTSNHLAGTAVDLNWDSHPVNVSRYQGFSASEINAVRHGQDLFEGTIFWGADWNSPLDPMHFQLRYPEGDARNAAFATKLSNGYLGIWTDGAPAIPEPVDGPRLLQRGVSGDDVARLQDGLNKVFNSYGKPLDVDGDFGPLTEAVVKEFQLRSGLLVDGIVGPATRAELLKYGINPEGGAAPKPPAQPAPPKAKSFPKDYSDRELLEYVAAQLGPKQAAWPESSSLGRNDKGEELTLRDGLAELKRKIEG